MANGYKPVFLNSRIINSLKPYFANKSIIMAAIYAGLKFVLLYFCYHL